MSELVAGVRAAAAGEAAITPRIAAGVLRIVRERLGEMPAEGREATLSSRELEVLRLMPRAARPRDRRGAGTAASRRSSTTSPTS